jgi:hypothetical protein
MKDIHIAIAANKQKVPRVVLKHSTGFIKNSTKYNVNESICRTESRKDTKQIELFNSVVWDLFPEDEKKSDSEAWFRCKIKEEGLFGDYFAYWYGPKSFIAKKTIFEQIPNDLVPEKLIKKQQRHKDLFDVEYQITNINE